MAAEVAEALATLRRARFTLGEIESLLRLTAAACSRFQAEHPGFDLEQFEGIHWQPPASVTIDLTDPRPVPEAAPRPT